MKNFIFYIALCFIAITLVACNVSATSTSGKQNFNINIGKSSMFSEEEIEDGIQLVIEEFKDLEGQSSIDIWYDEEKANKVVQKYLTTGKGSTNNINEENVLVIFSKIRSSSQEAKKS